MVEKTSIMFTPAKLVFTPKNTSSPRPAQKLQRSKPVLSYCLTFDMLMSSLL